MIDQPKASIDVLMAKVKALEEQGSLREALAVREIILDSSDPSPKTLFEFAGAAMDVGELDKAERALKLAIDKDPEFERVYRLLGIVHRDQGRHDLAREQLQKALRIKETPDSYVLLGSLELRRGMVEQAREYFENAIRCDPKYEEAYYNLGVIYIHYKDHKQPQLAAELFRKALDLDPEYALAHRELARALIKLRKLVEAREHLKKAMQLRPDDYRAYLYWGNLYISEHDPAAADEAFTIATELAPESEAILNLAIFYKFQRFTEEARELYERALVVHCDRATAEVEYAKFLSGIGEIESARGHLRQALQIEPDDAEAEKLLRELE